MTPVPVNVPKLDGNEAKYLREAIESGWISSEGPFVKKFEQQFAKRHGRKFAISVCNGTAALKCAVDSLDLTYGDEVIVPSFTIISCVTPIIESGATPVLVDCAVETFNSDPEQIISAITPKTKAIMLVHIYGLPVNAGPVLEFARERGIKIIEDAAEAIGQHYYERPCGSLGDISTFSFYPNKHVTTGEGGMILTDDIEIAERCVDARNLCFQTSRRFRHERIGWNFRITNIQAAIGLAQFEKLDQTINKKRWIGRKYNQLLENCPHVQLPLNETEYAKNIYWVYPLVLEDCSSMNAVEVMAKLGSLKIGTRPFFYPMHKQPVFHKMGLFLNQTLENSEELAEKGFYIPAGVGITEKEIDEVSNSLIKILSR